MKSIVGLDPGKTGALAIIDQYGVTAEAFPLYCNEIDIRQISEYLAPLVDPVCYLEKVGSRPGQGVKSMFTFGEGYGKLKGMMEALCIPYVLVTPQAWKKKVLAGLNWKGDKSAAIEFCHRKHPKMDLRASERARTPHMGICDALCIAEYGRMMEVNK